MADGQNTGDGIVLAVDGLSKSFGGLQAVSEVSFAVESGAIVGLIGPDGVGKVSFSGKDESASRTSRIASFIRRGKEHYGWDRKKLASLGASVMLSYGFISNVNACTLVTIAWVTCGRTTGLSPLAAGNWTAFLGIYGALYLSFGNLLRPIRASIAVAISPLFEKFVNFLQAKFKVRRPVAFGITVVLINVLGSLSYFALAISTACFVCKVPLLP